MLGMFPIFTYPLLSHPCKLDLCHIHVKEEPQTPKNQSGWHNYGLRMGSVSCSFEMCLLHLSSVAKEWKYKVTKDRPMIQLSSPMTYPPPLKSHSCSFTWGQLGGGWQYMSGSVCWIKMVCINICNSNYDVQISRTSVFF